MTLNVELLKQTLEYIEEHPEEHDQTIFRRVTECGTRMCFAGWACTLAGGAWVRDTSCLFPEPEDTREDLRNSRNQAVWQDISVPVVAVSDRASRVLGLTEAQADRLFYDARSVDDLRHTVKHILEEYELAQEKNR